MKSKKIKKVFKNFRFIVFGNEKNLFKIIFKTITDVELEKDITSSNAITLEDRFKRINLFYHENHFDFISSVSAFYGTRGYCEKYETPYKCHYE
jgi:hypothetical protein